MPPKRSTAACTAAATAFRRGCRSAPPAPGRRRPDRPRPRWPACPAAWGWARWSWPAARRWRRRRRRVAMARPMPRLAPVMTRVLPVRLRVMGRSPSCGAASPAPPGGWRWPRRTSGRPAAPGWKPSLAMPPGPAAATMSTQETSPRVAAQSRSAPVVARASAPATQRSGCGRPGKACTGGSGAEGHVLHAGGIAQPVGQRLARGHRALRRHLVDDVVDAGDDHRHVGLQARPRPAAAPASGRGQPGARQQLPVHLHRRRAASPRPAAPPAPRAGPTPTPAADESPATSSRSTGPRPTRRGAGRRPRAGAATARGSAAPAPPAAGSGPA
jgi:hypothetical protein